MDGRPTWTDCDKAGDYVVPNVLSPRDLVFRPDNMDETVPHTESNYLPSMILLHKIHIFKIVFGQNRLNFQPIIKIFAAHFRTN